MLVQVQVIKVYQMETDGGDTTDPESVNAHVRFVERMSSTEIEANGKLIDVSTEYAEAIGPDDEGE
jgi:hypothetical protein